jgi:predicted RNA-binding Zn-ribbon protein involved in translation (DUF1610 family)
MTPPKENRVYTTICYGCKKEVKFSYNSAKCTKAKYKGAEEYMKIPCPNCGELINQRVNEKRAYEL